MMSLVLFGEAAILLFYMPLGATIGLRLAMIYVLVVVLKIGEIFYNASVAAILPELVPTEKIKDAVSVSGVDDGIVQVAGPMLSAVIYFEHTHIGSLEHPGVGEFCSGKLAISDPPPICRSAVRPDGTVCHFIGFEGGGQIYP